MSLHAVSLFMGHVHQAMCLLLSKKRVHYCMYMCVCVCVCVCVQLDASVWGTVSSV